MHLLALLLLFAVPAEIPLRGHTDTITCLAYAPDGKTLASGAKDGIVLVWDIKEEKIRLTLKGHESMVTAVAFSPDGKVLATSSDDRLVKLWDAATGKELRTLRGSREQVRAVAFSPDGKLLAPTSLWEREGPRQFGVRRFIAALDHGPFRSDDGVRSWSE